MFWKRKPNLSQAARTLGQQGAATRKERRRMAYIAFHDRLAAKVGKRIEWAE